MGTAVVNTYEPQASFIKPGVINPNRRAANKKVTSSARKIKFLKVLLIQSYSTKAKKGTQIIAESKNSEMWVIAMGR